MHRTSSLFSIPTLSTAFCAAAFFLHVFYKRRVRRYGRNIKAAYAAKFEERAWIARSLNENLKLAILRSQFTVNSMRSSPRDVPAMKMGLNQITRWLDLAAEDGDTALRSLETSSKEATAFGIEGEEQWMRPNKSPS